MPRSGERKYDLRYYAEWFSEGIPPRSALLHARTLHGAKKESARRFPLRFPDDMRRILGVVRSGSNYRDQPVCIAEQAFPKRVWTDSDETWWFRMVEGEAELADGFASPNEEPPIPHARITSVAEALGISTYHLAKLLPDYGDVIAELSHIGILPLADAARYLNVKKCRVEQLRMQGRLGAVVRLPGRLFLRRKSVEAYAEWKRRDIEAFWERVRKLKAEERRDDGTTGVGFCRCECTRIAVHALSGERRRHVAAVQSDA